MLAVGIEFAVPADAIEFINENDGGFVFGGLSEESADTFGADANEDLGKIAAMSAKETGVRFAGDGRIRQSA